jgi:hypothetical protein
VIIDEHFADDRKPAEDLLEFSIWNFNVVVRCHPRCVEVTAEHVAQVPGENLRVSRAEFGALWALAEHLGDQPGPDDDYLVGVVLTCRWLANQPVWSPIVRRFEMPYAPVTWREHAAMPETIDAEYLAAVSPRAVQSEIARGAAATLEWTWHGSRRPPLDISSAAASRPCQPRSSARPSSRCGARSAVRPRGCQSVS